MKRQIRQSCFETNSSSTHAICIATNTDYDIPDSVNFTFGEFGWEVDELSSRRERAKYLYTALAYVDDWETIKKYLEFITNTLYKHGVKDIDFDSFSIDIYNWHGELHDYIRPNNECYIDHGNETREFVDAVCSDEWLLLDYLFSNKSFVLTGNDNDEIDTKIDVDYPHEEFYKGN